MLDPALLRNNFADIIAPTHDELEDNIGEMDLLFFLFEFFFQTRRKQVMMTPSHSTDNSNIHNQLLFSIPNEDAHLRTLWIGDLDGYMDENFVYSLFAHTNEVAQIKVIRDKGTGLGSGYGFVEFNNTEIAKFVLETHNGKPLPIGNGLSFEFKLSFLMIFL